MRELKFRAWNGKGEEMHPTMDKETFWRDGNLLLADSRILMQYTGLKDKNGKGIYEGDIVETKDKFRAAYIFKEGSFGIEHLDVFHVHSEDFEIIGNIYENPELV